MTSTAPQPRIAYPDWDRGGLSSIAPTPSPGIGHWTAHAKAILFGEHSVVYGEPAIAIPLQDLTVHARARVISSPSSVHCELYSGPATEAYASLAPTITALDIARKRWLRPQDQVDLRIEGDISLGRGLGSSAAVAAAIFGAIAAAAGHTLDGDEFYELVQGAETVAHGNPSGIDARAVLATAPLWFFGGRAKSLDTTSSWHFVIADSGVAGSTSETVAHVRKLSLADPLNTAVHIAALGDCARSAREAFLRGDKLEIGNLMNISHERLQALGVSIPELDRLAGVCRASGALGAKLTGGGGGGCIIALAPDAQAAGRIAADLRQHGTRSWTTVMGDR